MPNPYGGKWAGLTKEQYYKMDKEQQRQYHAAMYQAALIMMRKLRARNQPFDAPTEIVENELKALQEKRNFHGRQEQRIRGKHEMHPSVFSMEEEGEGIQRHRLFTTPMGEELEDMTEEEYNAASRQEKLNYHSRMRDRHKGTEKGKMHNVVLNTGLGNWTIKPEDYDPPYDVSDLRGKVNPHLPRGKHRQVRYVETKEEYDAMSEEDKKKFHQRIALRLRRSGENEELRKFHRKMFYRLKNTERFGKREVYYSPEEEAKSNE